MRSATHGAVPIKFAALVIVVVVLGAGVASYLVFFHGAPGGAQSVSQTSSVSQPSSQSGSLAQSATETSSNSASSSISSASSSSSSSSSSSTATSVGQISHVIIIVMENEEYSSVIGNASAPYQNGMATKYALAADYFGVAHPSLPNYLALVGGSTFGVTSDCLPIECGLPKNATAITSLLDSHGLSWKEYAESMPENCSQVNSPDGLYLTKHNPFVYFGAITADNGTGSTSPYCDSHVVSLSQFSLDLQSGRLPNYSFITPNICDDAHSCPLSTGDRWLSAIVPKIVNSSSFASTALFIVYDEGSSDDLSGGGGQVACILVSPFAKMGYASHTAYSHYSLLATVEAIFNLGNLGRSDATATPMSDLFTSQFPRFG